ncbi:MAG: aminotransferase [Pseudomonadota bacterium]
MRNAIAEQDKQYVLHPYTNLSAHQELDPFIITHGEGVYVWDDQGNKLIEGMSGLWCASLGFNEQRLTEAATRQMQKLPYSHLFSHRSTEPAIELSQKLIDIAPDNMARVFLVNSGSEAVDMAIKIVWYYNNALGRPNKKKIISRKRAYHGITIASGSLTGLPYVHNGFDLPAIPVMHTETPHYYREGHEGESEDAFTDRLADTLEQQIIEEGADNIAAFIAEPVMGAGGVLVPPANYFEKIQAVLDRHDILLICDEVICGFARTGEMFGSQTFNAKPDLMTVAKQLSSAYLPIGGVMLSEKVYDALVTGSDQHGMFGSGNTYGGHPVAAAVAIETLNIYAERDIVNHVKSLSSQFSEGLQALTSHPLVGQARSVGLIGAIEIVKDKTTREQYPVGDKIAAQIANHARNHQLILRPTPGDSVALCPPLIINEVELKLIFERLGNALDDMYKSMA